MKTNNKGFAVVELVVVVVVVAVISGLGFYLFKRDKNITPQASAAGYTTLKSSNSKVSFKACKVAKSSSYGTVYQVKGVFTSTAPTTQGTSITVIRNGVQIALKNGSGWVGKSQSIQVNASAPLKDKVRFDIWGSQQPTGVASLNGLTEIDPSKLANC